MLATQTNKSKQPLPSLPKLQKTVKTEIPEVLEQNSYSSPPSPISSPQPLQTERKDTNWSASSEKEYLQRQEGSSPKPAQNIAVMSGKRYIVVPKNNAMAVQPAITMKQDKIADKAPAFRDSCDIPHPAVIKEFETKLSAQEPTTTRKESEDCNHMSEEIEDFTSVEFGVTQPDHEPLTAEMHKIFPSNESLTKLEAEDMIPTDRDRPIASSIDEESSNTINKDDESVKSNTSSIFGR